MNEAELKAAVTASNQQRNGRCEFVLGNGTPAGWGVTIIEAGFKFFYRDGTDDTDGPRGVNINGPDGYTSFFSKVPSKCVYQIYGVIKVRASGEPNDAVYEYRDTVEAGKCFIRTGATLGPKNSISEAEHSTGDWQHALEIIKA